MKSLNLEVLKDIAVETRQCFLHEDAPTYIANLQKGLLQLQAGQPDYVFLMHAAHSLKGGSGIAELTSLSQIAHKLEDLLEILQHNEFCDRKTIAEVLSDGIDEVASVIAQAVSLPTHTLGDIEVDQALLQRLDTLLAIVKQEEDGQKQARAEENSDNEIPAPPSTVSAIVLAALEKDLEACIQQLENQVLAKSGELSASKIKEELQFFCEECFLLGDAFGIQWISKTVEPLEVNLQQNIEINSLFAEAKAIIVSLRSQRHQYLHPQSKQASNEIEVIEEIVTSVPVPNPIPEQALAVVETSTTPTTVTNQAIATPRATISYLRIPSSQIENMTNTVAEMILRHERLLRQQQQLGQANKNLQALALQIIPLQDQVQKLYDGLAIANTNNDNSDSDDEHPESSLENQTDDVSDDFDQLELDQYSSSHTTLQNLQEVLLRVRESRSDIDLSYREFSEEIQYLRQDLDNLYAELTQSRLVPFKTVANRFLPQLKRLCQRYHKQVDLIIEGEDVLIDQVVLEQLQTPLNHLIINAFDHGVESPEMRVERGKPETATIVLSAMIASNQVIICLKDDGDGINLNRVYEKAVANKVFPADIPIGKIPRQEILNFIFQPHFSTRNVVTDISGRGMGLDIVRSQINRLRGTIQVETLPGQGTTFTIRLPIGLSLVALLICAINDNLLAIPASDILDIFAYDEDDSHHKHNGLGITWRKQFIPLLHLKQSLTYSQQHYDGDQGKICLILNRNDQAIAVVIDSIQEERQLILKPFDNSVAVPSYLMGCTVLGTGQVVPVLSAENLHILLQESIEKKVKKSRRRIVKSSNTSPTIKTVLVAEDSIATRNLLERLLKQLDFEVIACRDGQEAIDMLTRSQGKVSMVISDIEMPRVNGFNLLQNIRTHEHWYALPVVMLTSRTGDRHRQKAISLGANKYLSKPVVVSELIDCLSEFVK
ncbi:hybrid sensor histidine kinase/response regulator [Pseudanabaena mucicola]|uniref:histidine kinase n=1 Tax=Pseudanabaena mucicola FACHB-723 TaxID=2692860 RepID=A0ABR7ZY10_9CYAN|nr:response regulator [Pseudanabaena mucicola]MBD2188669.1 response regulator [Pseudanabaena mucicola FACHB-723]